MSLPCVALPYPLRAEPDRRYRPRLKLSRGGMESTGDAQAHVPSRHEPAATPLPHETRMNVAH